MTLLSVVMDYWLVLARINYLKIKHLNDGLFTCTHKHTHCFSLHKMDWSHVDYLWIIVMFWSAVRTFILTAPICSAEDPLVSKWCQISSNLLQLRNTHLHLGWPGGEYISAFILFNFGGTCFNGIVDFTWYSNCYSHYQIKLFPPKLKCSNEGSIVLPWVH